MNVYKLTPYPLEMTVCFNSDAKDVYQAFVYFDNSEKNVSSAYYSNMPSNTSPIVENIETGKYGIIVSIDEKASADEIAHESCHVAQLVFEYIGDVNPSKEAFAYLVQYVFKIIYNYATDREIYSC